MINKYVSILAGFAAVQGAMAALPENHPVRTSAGYRDACHQDDVPKEGPNYPCNEVSLYQASCEVAENSLEDQQKCICQPWFWDNQDGCVSCKDVHGLDGPKGTAHWSAILKKTEQTYCGAGKVDKTFRQVFDEVANTAGPPPMHGPDNLPNNRALSDISVKRYWTPKTSKPDAAKCAEAKCEAKPSASATVPLPYKMVAVARATVSAGGSVATASTVATTLAPKPSGVRFPTNGTVPAVVPGASASAVAKADIVLREIQFPCVAVYKSLAAGSVPQYQCGQPEVVPNVKLEAMALAEVTIDLSHFQDAAWCGCVANQVPTGQKVVIAKAEAHAEATAGFTVFRPSEDKKTLVIDEKATNGKPIAGAGPGAEPKGAPVYQAPICVTPANKAQAAGSSPDGKVSAHAEAKATVTVVQKGGNPVYVPAAVAKAEAGPSGSQPAAGPSGQAPAAAAGEEVPASNGAAPAGSSPAGSSPAGSAPAGSAPAGSAPAGAAPQGSSPAGSSPAAGAPAGAPAGAAPKGAAAPSGNIAQTTGLPVIGANGAASMRVPALAGALAAVMVAAF